MTGTPTRLTAVCWYVPGDGDDGDNHYLDEHTARANAPAGTDPVQFDSACLELECARGCGASPCHGAYHHRTYDEAIYDAYCGNWALYHRSFTCPDCPPAPRPREKQGARYGGWGDIDQITADLVDLRDTVRELDRRRPGTAPDLTSIVEKLADTIGR